jgi:drug/metabolite transporter (DMT)-like permease
MTRRKSSNLLFRMNKFLYLLFRYLRSSQRPRFSSRWWKIILWFGSLLVISGFVLLLIGFILPQKQVNVDDSSSRNSQVIIVDRQALAFNANLDATHLIGICLVIAGGILFTLSLLMPTFCHMWCATGDSNDETDPFKVFFSKLFLLK